MLLTWVEIKDGIGMALGAINQNKFRAFLTILGVMVGVGTVIMLASIISGLRGAVVEEIEALGSNTIEVHVYEPGVDWDNLTAEQRNRPQITVGEAEAIKATCPSVEGVAPQNHYWKNGGNEVKYRNRKGNNPPVVGTWPEYMAVRDAHLMMGRFLTPIDLQFRAQVAVIGAELAQTLFEGDSPINKEIRVNGYRFRVIGVFEPVETNFDEDERNTMVAMPLSTFEKMYPEDEALTLVVRAESIERIEQAKEEMVSTLRKYRKVPFNKENNFALVTQESRQEDADEIIGYLYIAMIVITSVGLMVGGIGVMNIMLVSVTERTREIGIRKAIGAKRSNIVLQFLTEAMTLSGSGGLIGVIFGVAFGLIINAAFGFPLSVSMFWVVLGFVVAVSVGLISGMYPAIKASRLDPIEALRYE